VKATKRDKGTCPACSGIYTIGKDGDLRQHPRTAGPKCPGSGQPPLGAPDAATPPPAPLQAGPDAATPVAPPTPTVVPGIYRSPEAMLETSTPVPPGHAALSLIAYFPYDPAVRSPREEATLLYEDPNHLYRVLDALPNHHVRLVVRIDP